MTIDKLEKLIVAAVLSVLLCGTMAYLWLETFDGADDNPNDACTRTEPTK